MKRLHAKWGHAVSFATILIRQGHPGPDVPPYQTFEEKQRDARRHQWEDAIPWPVLVDDVAGTVHRAYGMLADPTVLVDVDGTIAFYNAITHAPTLDRALSRLFRQQGRGVVLGGTDRKPHLLATIVGGWPALKRGLPQSAVDLETAFPTTALLPFVGDKLRPLVSPVALRATPLPRPKRSTILAAAAALALGAMALRAARRRDEAPTDSAPEVGDTGEAQSSPSSTRSGLSGSAANPVPRSSSTTSS